MKRVLSVVLARSMALSLAACGGGSKPTEASTTAVAGDTTITAAVDIIAADTATAPEAGIEVTNKNGPLVWSNRQSSSSATGQLDITALDFNKDTYYVGFDTNQGVELQGTMAKDHIEENTDSIGRNGDGIIGYVLVIGDIGHNDSIVHTRGIRKVLGTAIEKDGSINNDLVGTNADGTATVVQDGSIEVGGKTYIVRELALQEMKNSAGATWDAATANNTIGTWSSPFGDQIDVVAPNSDGIGMFMFSVWSKDNRVPTLGYDANSGAVAAVTEGYGSTTNRHTDAQTYLTLRVLCNVLDGADIDTGIGTVDDAGDVLSSDIYVCKADECFYYVLNVAVTAENYTDFIDSTMVYVPISNQPDETSHATKNIWLNIYNSADNFLGSTYQPLLQKRNKLLNPKADYIGNNGQTGSNIINRFGNPSQYDAFAINIVKTDNAASYTFLLKQQYSLK